MPPRRRPPRPGALTDLSPLKILRKIVALQLLYYVSATVLIVFTTLVAGQAFSMDLIFGWSSIRGDTTVGWMLSLVWFMNSLPSVVFLLVIVSRSKLIPDFALTIHFIHLLVVFFWTHSVPGHLLWWGVQLASAAFMTFAGIWACQKRELRPITFGLGLGGPNTSNNNNNNQSRHEDGGAGNSAQEGNDDPETGLLSGTSRGRGRGRNRESGSEYYEMGPMKKESEAVAAGGS